MGCNQIRLDLVDSTNNYTATLINGNAAEGTVVITHEQTAGRGQRGNLWISEPGKNLTLTYLLRPKFLRISDQFILNKANTDYSNLIGIVQWYSSTSITEHRLSR